MPVIPASRMLEPSLSSRLASASTSFGVANMHRMSCPAESTVTAWSITCSWYAFRWSIQPFLMSFTSHRGSRSTQKRSEEHTSELQSRLHLVCRLLLEKKKKNKKE